jgi:hypothetical protein
LATDPLSQLAALHQTGFDNTSRPVKRQVGSFFPRAFVPWTAAKWRFDRAEKPLRMLFRDDIFNR